MNEDRFNLSDEKHMVKNARAYAVVPALPENFKTMLEIAYNVWWVWNSQAFELFRPSLSTHQSVPPSSKLAPLPRCA